MKKVLVANRGEIALRVIRACRELGLLTVGVYSTADGTSRHVDAADEAICIGRPKPAGSYLATHTIVQVALATGCDAVHPGYGFLSENADFADACVDNGLTFVGPSGQVIREFGDKIYGRHLAADLDVPVVPGTSGEQVSLQDVVHLGEQAGFPILLKAAAGGGGRGMRVASESTELASLFTNAQAEAQAAFGDGTVYAERYLPSVRHVEVQILGDHHGHVVHLGTRDCTVQRRHQKIIEEAPAVSVPAATREALAADAVRLARHLQYVGAGTVEFVVDIDTGQHYFIEMNTRIQVEHPVTEMTTSIDLVREQLLAADPANRLSITQEDIDWRGHAIEFRINAEQPSRSFAPSPGVLSTLQLPAGPGVRFDSHCYPGYQITPFYDSMIAKLIVHDQDRPWALRRAERVLDELAVGGVQTNRDFLHAVLTHPHFSDNTITTTWAERYLSELLDAAAPQEPTTTPEPDPLKQETAR